MGTPYTRTGILTAIKQNGYVTVYNWNATAKTKRTSYEVARQLEDEGVIRRHQTFKDYIVFK